jgi:hypothetical protein
MITRFIALFLMFSTFYLTFFGRNGHTGADVPLNIKQKNLMAS